MSWTGNDTAITEPAGFISVLRIRNVWYAITMTPFSRLPIVCLLTQSEIEQGVGQFTTRQWLRRLAFTHPPFPSPLSPCSCFILFLPYLHIFIYIYIYIHIYLSFFFFFFIYLLCLPHRYTASPPLFFPFVPSQLSRPFQPFLCLYSLISFLLQHCRFVRIVSLLFTSYSGHLDQFRNGIGFFPLESRRCMCLWVPLLFLRLCSGIRVA